MVQKQQLIDLTAFGSDGFTLVSDITGTNDNGGTMASWNWKANGAGSANTDGYINTTVSVNTQQDFIVKYTGTGKSGNNNCWSWVRCSTTMMIVECLEVN